MWCWKQNILCQYWCIFIPVIIFFTTYGIHIFYSFHIFVRIFILLDFCNPRNSQLSSFHFTKQTFVSIKFVFHILLRKTIKTDPYVYLTSRNNLPPMTWYILETTLYLKLTIRETIVIKNDNPREKRTQKWQSKRIQNSKLVIRETIVLLGFLPAIQVLWSFEFAFLTNALFL